MVCALNVMLWNTFLSLRLHKYMGLILRLGIFITIYIILFCHQIFYLSNSVILVCDIT